RPLSVTAMRTGSGTHRHQRDLHAAVGGAAGLGVVAGDRIALAGADGDEALRVDALRDQELGHRIGTLLGQALVDLVAADAVGVAGDLDDGLVVLLDHIGDAAEHRVELRVQVRAVEAEGHVARHVQGDVVAVAGDADAGTLQLGAQRGLLAILVGTHGAAGQAADAGADQGVLAALDRALAGQQAGGRTDAGADQRTLAGAVHLLLAGIRVRGLPASGQDGDQRGGAEHGQGLLADVHEVLLVRMRGPVGPRRTDASPGPVNGQWRPGLVPTDGYSNEPTASLARLSKRVYSPKKRSLTEPVGPLRCLPMMTSASPLSGEFSLL